MRTLKLHFPDDALPTLEPFLKQTKEARVFRRAQAVRDVVKGHRLQTVSDTLHFTYSLSRMTLHFSCYLIVPWELYSSDSSMSSCQYRSSSLRISAIAARHVSGVTFSNPSSRWTRSPAMV